MTTTKPLAHGVHLVGSIPLQSNDAVFRTASSILGGRLRRIPDGETGERSDWIVWQAGVLQRQPELALIPPDPGAYAPLPQFTLRSATSGVTFGPLGYAGAALASYVVFSRLKQEGVLPPHYRFQVSLPTPLAVMGAFIVPENQVAVEPAYEERLLTELDTILAAIPHDEAAIQWDVAIEVAMLEGVMPAPFQDVRERILERLIRVGERVPADVELGYHLCYGDAEHHHFSSNRTTCLHWWILPTR